MSISPQHPRTPPRILITAGPTQEPIDAVRYIANRSSGRMGLALVQAALKRSWPTTLLLGPANLGVPDHSLLRIARFQTTENLRQLLAVEWPRHDVLFMAAAVADYRLAKDRSEVKRQDQQGKLPRTNERLTLSLEPTPDLLAELAPNTRADQTVIGFALEPEDRLMQSAAEKLQRKHLDAIVANPLETMDSQTVSAALLLRDGTKHAPPVNLPKTEFAEWLFQRLQPMLSSKTVPAARE